MGTTPNALKTQIRVAPIAILARKYLQPPIAYELSLSNPVALLRQPLSVFRDL